jgi:hypothetical protein
MSDSSESALARADEMLGETVVDPSARPRVMDAVRETVGAHLGLVPRRYQSGEVDYKWAMPCQGGLAKRAMRAISWPWPCVPVFW